MKLYIILGVTVILGHVFCSELPDQGMTFLNVKPEYNSKDKITFKIKNSSDTGYQYYVDLDVFYSGSWRPASINDIDTSAPIGGAIVKLLPAHSTIEVVEGPLYIRPTKNSNRKEDSLATWYRLVLHYRLANDSDFKNKIFSRRFIFK